jgi:hypothetical protein
MYPISDRHTTQGRAGKINLKVVGCAGAGLFGLLCLVCGGGGVAGYFFWYKPRAEAAKEKEIQEIRDTFTPALSSYLDIKIKPPTQAKGKFKGKVVCVDTINKKIDAETQAALPAALKATKLDEVGCVAMLTWSEEEAGDYPDGSKAKIHVVVVLLIEKKTETVLLSGKVINGDKQATKLTGGDRVGPKPFDQLAELLQEYADPN